MESARVVQMRRPQNEAGDAGWAWRWFFVALGMY
jgi:hypothetical protein